MKIHYFGIIFGWNVTNPRTTLYNIMKKCRSTSHYILSLRSLKKKKQSEIKVSVSKRILKTRNTDYLKTVRNIRRRNFNSSLIVDGVLGNVNIAMHFQDTFYTLFNSVQS